MQCKALFCLAVLTGVTACGSSGPPPGARGPAEVGVFLVKPESVSVVTELPGRTVAWRVAQVRPQVGGVIQKRLYTEGAQVAAGQQLYQIDPAPFQALLDSASAALAKANANVYTTQLKYQRYLKLAETGAISQQDKDDVTAALKQAEADVATAKAGETTARLNLDYTRVRSPIAGRSGMSAFTEGALVTANQETALTTVQQYDPIYVDITQDAGDALDLRGQLQSGALKRDGSGKLPVEIRLADGSVHPQKGTLEFSGITVSEDTGAITLRAIVPNNGGRLLPGMYVHALVSQGTDTRALMIPQQGVSHDGAGRSIALVVGNDSKVERRVLTTGRAVGDRWLVLDGLAEGDRVIVQGSQRVKPGDTVKVVDIPASPAPSGPPPAAGGGTASAQ